MQIEWVCLFAAMESVVSQRVRAFVRAVHADGDGGRPAVTLGALRELDQNCSTYVACAQTNPRLHVFKRL